MRDVFEIILCAMITLLGLFMTICPQKSLKDEKRGDPEAIKKMRRNGIIVMILGAAAAIVIIITNSLC